MEKITTLEQAERVHRDAVLANQQLPIVEYNSNEKQSDQVHEVTEGFKHLPGPDGTIKTLGPGNRFHPTERQILTGALEGKTRELTRSEYKELKSGKTISMAGSDIGVRALPMSSALQKLALEKGLREEDFAGVEPAGAGGQYTKAQVEELAAAKAKVS
jgi:hypothetical protein